jgi:hypothetical protein
MAACHNGKDWRRYLKIAKTAARREEAEAAEHERQERAERRAEFNRAFERAQRERAKGARI